MRRFFVPPGTVRGRDVALGAELAHRLGRVLRLKPGDRIVLADGGAVEYEVELRSLSARAATGVVVGQRAAPPEPCPELVLYQSLIRGPRFELVLEKGTEVGVSRFVPVVSGRSQVRPAGEPGRLERWRRIVVEAAEQCGRGKPPVVDAPLPLAQALRDDTASVRIMPWEGERLRGLGVYLRGLKERPQRVGLFIGPEGGWGPEEVAAARRAGVVLVSLGPRILRSETAGIVAAALVMHELGEMGD